MWREIVGVVGSVSRIASLEKEVNGMGEVYLPEAQYPDSTMTFVLRTTRNPLSLAEPLRRIIRQVDIDQPLFQVQTMEDALAAGRSTQTLAAWVLGVFGLTALLLSSLGIYGVMAFNVRRRWHEFGIRMSLGARPADVLKLVTRQTFALNLAGSRHRPRGRLGAHRPDVVTALRSRRHGPDELCGGCHSSPR